MAPILPSENGAAPTGNSFSQMSSSTTPIIKAILKFPSKKPTTEQETNGWEINTCSTAVVSNATIPPQILNATNRYNMIHLSSSYDLKI